MQWDPDQCLAQRRDLLLTEIKPVTARQRQDGNWFIDFGRAVFGTVRFCAESAVAGVIVEVHLGERLIGPLELDRCPPGSIRHREVRLQLAAGTRNYQVLIPPDERNTGPAAIKMPTHLFEVLPFRYAEIILPPGAALHDIVQVAVHYPFDDSAAEFASSDSRLNKVWELCRYSIKATSFCGIYIDGDRERIPYEGDAYINQLCHYGVDRDYEMARYSLEYLLFHPTWPTEWSLHCVPMAWADYMYSGDNRLLARYYDELKAKMLLPLARADGLISTETGLVTTDLLASLHLSCQLADLVDWPPGSFADSGTGERDSYDMVPVKTVINAFHYWNLLLFARIAAVLGRVDDQQFCEHRGRLLAQAINNSFFDPARGIYIDGEGSQHAALHANMLPAAVGLMPSARRGSITEFIKSRGMACSVYGAQYLLEALYELGDAQAALDLMTAEHDRGWLNMLNVGSTMTLEAWDWCYKKNLDWNHAWGAVPANIIPRRLVGVTPLTPGAETVRVAPRPAGLASFNARVPLKSGSVQVAFERAGDNHFQIAIELPDSLSGRLDMSGLTAPGASLRINGHAVNAPALGDIELGPGKHCLES